MLRKCLFVVVLLGVTAAGLYAVKPLTSGRLTNAAFASQSISYRLQLQSVGLKHLGDEPFIGYGSSSLQKPLACNNLQASALRKTCHSGFYFDSTHNVFLDRFLGLGWFGGLSFMAVSGLLLWQGLKRPANRLFALAALLIALYYCTNVTCIEIEMLYWICLLRTPSHDCVENPA